MIFETKPMGPSHARRYGSAARGFSLAILAALLVACSDAGTQDLQDFVLAEKMKRGQIEPLPEFLPVETYIYTAQVEKDPFATWKSDVKASEETTTSLGGVRPNVDRRKELLENFPLDTLRMMGTLEYQNGMWGLVKAPDGIIYRVKTGNYMGQNYGRITQIQEKTMVLKEIVPDGLGGWEEREATLAVSEE